MEAVDLQEMARSLYRENLWLRALLRTVAEDLEGLAVRKPVRRRCCWKGYPDPEAALGGSA